MTDIQKVRTRYEDEILDLIDNQDEFTRSDLQGIVSALVQKIMLDSTNIDYILKANREAQEAILHIVR
jgi:hypothetical protein